MAKSLLICLKVCQVNKFNDNKNTTKEVPLIQTVCSGIVRVRVQLLMQF